MSFYRIKRSSDLIKKLERLEDAFQDAGLSLMFEGSVMLRESSSGRMFHLLDLETNVDWLEQGGAYISEFPPQLEYKLCWEKEEEG